jgi:hypothetical protein
MKRPVIIPGSTTKSELPHHAEAERLVDEWEAGGIRYQLVERGGIYALRAWDLYRYKPLGTGGAQILARRLADLLRGERAEVVDLDRKRRRL